jgi:hypothetical protein
MAQVVSCRILTTETWVRDRASPCGICGGQSDTGAGFSPSSLFSPDNIIPPWLSLPILLSPGDENRLVGGSGSETQSHPIDMNNISIPKMTKFVHTI